MSEDEGVGGALRLLLLAAGAFALSAGLAFLFLAGGDERRDVGAAELGEDGGRIDSGLPGQDRLRGLLGQAGLDQELAASLGAADGEPDPEGPNANVITFRRLSLVGTDMDLLFDRLFKLPEEVAKLPPYEFPEGVLALDGERIELLGYMIATEWADARVTEFMLVRDTGSCCFGGIPRPDEWVLVRMAEGRSCENHAYVPVVAEGLFELLPPGDDPQLPAVYTMTGESVRTYY